MKIKINKKYLIVPTNSNAKIKKLRFLENGKEISYFKAKLDALDPDFYAYMDVSKYLGKELELNIFPWVDVPFTQSDVPEKEFEDILRPDLHFTVSRGWSNDPNGLLFVNGEYHLFYQYNPVTREFIHNMNWGHAISKDLIHWKECEIALSPDETGAMFSGSVIIDENNLLGKQENEQKTIVLFYTAAGHCCFHPVPYSIRLAYSTDGLKTFHKLERPLSLTNLSKDNRDPKVSWCEELKSYVMALYVTGEEYGLFVSDNLTEWTLLQRISLSGERECPNFFPIVAENGARKWVLSGAHETYLVGEFQQGKFVPTQTEKRLCHDTDAYASQIYNEHLNGRVLRIAWGMWGILRAKQFTQQMSLPCEVKMQAIGEEYFLTYTPVPELKNAATKTDTFENIVLFKNEKQKYETAYEAIDLQLKGDFLDSLILTVLCFGTEIVIDLIKNEIRICGYVNTLSVHRKVLDVEIVADHSGIEIFCDGGKIAFMACAGAVCDCNLPYVEILSTHDYTLRQLTLNHFEKTRKKRI